MTKIKYIENSPHPITIGLIGVGGTGSQLLQFLGRIHTSLKAIGKQGIHCIVQDGDTVTKANVGRQLFTKVDIGQNKATALVSKINRFYGTQWEDEPYYFDSYNRSDVAASNIVISCVDKWAIRQEIQTAVNQLCYQQFNERHTFHLWMDCGNGKDYGQVITGSPKYGLPTVIDTYPVVTEDDNTPSCSLAEALKHQDLFINTAIALSAATTLWQLLSTGEIHTTKSFCNLSNSIQYAHN